MAKGRYIKAAERACTGKARFESALEAEQSSDWRFRAYQCPVCHAFHLTSRDSVTTTEPAKRTTPKDPAGPKLGDLDWSSALDPQPKVKAPRPPKPVKPRLPEPPPFQLARCLSAAGKDGRIRLVLDGRMRKSAVVRDFALRSLLKENVMIRVSLDEPPVVMGIDS